jgi:hypothetical protein
MFDLTKGLEGYRGVPPYASEHFGIYQPLLGWQSRLTKEWVRLGTQIIDPRIKKILDGRIKPGTTGGDGPTAVRLGIGSAKNPWRVTLLKDLDSELMQWLRDRVQEFVDANKGHLPVGPQWNQLIDRENFKNIEQENGGPLRIVFNRHWTAIKKRYIAKFGPPPTPEQELPEIAEGPAGQESLAINEYESQIAGMLLAYAEGQDGHDPDELARFFAVSEAPPLEAVFDSPDPLASIDPTDRSGVLSPVGFVHLFRQYFFDLGTFLGEPVEHIWLAPGTTTELIEVSTRRRLIERTEEEAFESTSRSERTETVKDEISDAVKAENSSSTKIGVSTTQSVNFGVYEGSATGKVDVESGLKDAREKIHKQNREQTEKLATEIKRSFKSVFKTVTETTDTRTKRYLIQNPGQKLVNYELRRKMRRVGVQQQDLGTQLCWQVFVDDPGATLGLADLIHFAESPELANLKAPTPLPPPMSIPVKVTVPIPFNPINHSDNGEAIYEYKYAEFHHGNRINTNNEDEQDKQIVMGPFRFKFDPPQPDYVMEEVRVLGPQGNMTGQVRAGSPTINKDPKDQPDGTFDVIMQRLCFKGNQNVPLDVEIVYKPTSVATTAYENLKKKAEAEYTEEKYRVIQESYTKRVRDRIKQASSIKQRPAWDLREEERTVVYRNLLRRLMVDSWQGEEMHPPLRDDSDQRRVNHVRSEIIRAIFDVDAMMYFVAPEWWMPRRHRTSHTFNAVVDVPQTADKPADNKDAPHTVNLTEENKTRWSDVPMREDNYSITEESEPARYGSSLGWLIQLDADNLRNAFLNAPWVKAIIPIRPGRESAALNWLRFIEGHENDGWGKKFKPVSKEEIALFAELKKDKEDPTLGDVLQKIAEKLGQQNAKIQSTLAADKVFESGFDPLKNSFVETIDPKDPNKPFSQWITVLPTDQIVASTYEPTEYFED